MGAYPGFIGSSHRVRSGNVNAERTINWYLERPPGNAAVQEWLAPTPGLTPFTVLPTGPVRALWAMDGRAFAVGGTGFFELFASGTATVRGSVNQNAFPATISGNGANGQQLLVTSAGINWIYDLEAETFTLVDVDNPPTPTRMSLFSDGYFIALKANTNQFNISALYDGTTWDPLDVFQVSTVADQVVAVVETHRDLWLLGSQTSSVWSNTGDEIVYQPVPGVKIDQGCGAAFSAVRIDNAIMWLGQSEAGDRVVWRADGYTPRRVSTHAVEFALGQASRVDDAIAWAYQQEGHLFYVLYVPALADVRDWGTTWVYDVATDQWHERAWWDTTDLQWQPHLGRCHAFGFGRHLVGSRDSGAIYDLRLDMAHDTVVVGGAGGGRPEVPTLTAVTPVGGDQGATVALTLTGTGFVPAATTVAISGADVVVSDVLVSSTTQLSADVWIAPTATLGARTVAVTTTAGTSNTRPFTVSAAQVTPGAPTLTTVSPNTGVQGAAVAVTLTGTDFVVAGTTVAVGGTGVTVSAVSVSSATTLTATFTLAAGATVSARTVTVTTAGGTSGGQTFTVTAAVVTPAVPTLTSVVPAAGDQGDAVSVTLTGTGFIIGATTVAVSGTGVTVSAVVVSSVTSLTATFTLTGGATLGPRSVTVTTAGGTSSAQTFTVTSVGVTPTPPTLTSVSPTVGDQGDAVGVTLTGTYFVVGATTVAVSGTGVTVSAVVVASATSLTATFTIAGGATLGARTVTVTTADGTSNTRPFTVEDPGAPVGDLDPLVASDLTLAGHQVVDLNYANFAFTIRYVGGERRFLFYQYDGWQPNRVGDVIEYRLNPAGLKNGGSHWTLGAVPLLVEVRRWHTWHTRQRMLDDGYPNADSVFGGNGVWPASFHWDEATGRLWYTWQPQYPGGAIIWPAYSATTLADNEAIVVGDAATAGRSVSDGNIHGPWYFRDGTVHDDWAQSACGLIPIPAERQAAMGGTHLAVGHHKANVGSAGPRGVGFWVVNGLPATLPAEGAELWPDAASTLIYDTSPATGATPNSNMKLPNVQFQACGHASQGTIFSFSAAGAPASTVSVPVSAGTAVNDAIYQSDYGTIDCLSIYMTTPASGGTFVPEIWNGSAWVQPPGWTVSVGTAALSGAENVFSWPSAAMVGGTVRLRRTSAGTSGGSIKAVITTTGLITGNEYPDRPLGEGENALIGSEQYDATHYRYAYEEIFWGGAWVRTAAVEGLAYFGPVQTSGQWYGAAPAYMQPIGGGTPIKRHYYDSGESYSNGGKSEGPRYPYFFPFATDDVLECAAGTRARNGDGLQPAAFTRMPTQWPDLVIPRTVGNPESLYPGYASYNVYGYGHSVVFDPVTNQVIVWMSCGSVWSNTPILAFFDVRTA